MAAAEGCEVDEGLYSRQLYVMGAAAMQKMSKYSVLVCGQSGLGAEVVKDLVLAGIKRVCLFDPTPATTADLSSHFYLTESDLGQPRAAACVAKMQELNAYVTVDALSEPSLTAEAIAPFEMVVCVDQSRAELVRVSELCRDAGKHMVATGTMGLIGYCFTDLGDSFTCSDTTGEEPSSGVVVAVTSDSPVLVETDDKGRHGLQEGDSVSFTHVEGMGDGFNGQVFKVTSVPSPSQFTIDLDGSSLPVYQGGGYFSEVKQPAELAFKPLTSFLAVDAADQPAAPLAAAPNVTCFGRPQQLWLLIQALWDFAAEGGGGAQWRGALPVPGRVADAARVEALYAARAAACDTAQEDKLASADVLALASCARGELTGLAAVFGGVAAQECLKASSGKFAPLNQFWLQDWAAAAPELPADGAEEDRTVEGEGEALSRYAGQVAVFGRGFQDQLARQKVFLVGAGALGCEFLKHFACMGLGTAAGGGQVQVTDLDTIERSNLNRQFLFRSRDIGAFKSVAASAAARAMNPHTALEASTVRVGTDTEDTWTAGFWASRDVVVNALDNAQARLYVDGKCIEHGLPLMESGTLGTKCHTQAILPGLTMSYGSIQDPPEDKIAYCTLKSFPHLIEHTLEWARDLFEQRFHNEAEEVVQFLQRGKAGYFESVQQQRNEMVARLRAVVQLTATERAARYADCVAWARRLFEVLFVHAIRDILHQHPADKVGDDGKPFWSKKRRAPTPERFDFRDPLHRDFVLAAASIRARQFGLEDGASDLAAVEAALAEAAVPEWTPSSEVIAATEEEQKELEKKAEGEAATAGGGGGEGETLEEQAAGLLGQLQEAEALTASGFSLQAEDFEKDDDSNGHMAFISSAANIRARQYRIPVESRMKCKQIVGKIIPAIATTTAIATGLVCMELMKVVQGKHRGEAEAALAQFVDWNVNLASGQQFLTFEPQPCETYEFGGKAGYSLWSFLDVPKASGVTTVQELIDFLEEQFEITVERMFSTGKEAVQVYDSLGAEEEELEMAVVDAVAEATGEEAFGPWIVLNVHPEGDDDGFGGSDSEDDDAASAVGGAGGSDAGSDAGDGSKMPPVRFWLQ